MKTVLVTGANSGIGYYISRRLAANGFYVYAGIRNSDNFGVFDGIDNVEIIKLDVTSKSDIAAAAEHIGDLYGIVNNAGIQRFSTMNEITEDELHNMFDTNVFAPCVINKAFAHKLISSGGRTITIGSISGFIAWSGNAAYSMTKSALEAYTDAYSQEMKKVGVHVGIVEPGGYNSNILRNADNESLSPEVRKSIKNQLRRFALTGKDPHDVSGAVLHAMTSDNPKRRYMIVPIEQQAKDTINSALNKVVELNQDQEYEYSRDDLVKMLDLLLDESSSE